MTYFHSEPRRDEDDFLMDAYDDRYEAEAWGWEGEVMMAYWDDDPNPYDGTYSEM